ncbi:TPM domain-containing protein [Allosphingosinicella sp.]|uniref:TPM domain-containing protein n=1 Tax=Allosphingosinicella sp. TaxID=2823234 RepID=UPI0037833218
MRAGGALAALLFLVLAAGAAWAALSFPPLSGRVVDQANLLSPQQEAELTQKLETLQRASSRQLVVATVTSLQDVPIEDYGYQLGRAWHIGQQGANNGVILLVAPNEKRVRIEVGYGLEPIMTDALSNQIIQEQILPRFRDHNDYAGGIIAGSDAIIAQLQAPLEAAEQNAAAAERAQADSGRSRGGRHRSSSPLPLIFWIGVTIFIIFGLTRSGLRGKSYRRRRRGWGGPIVIWGPGWGGGHRSSGWDDWGGGGGGWGGGSWGGGGGGGGFSGGGGSFGGGGASGGW